MTASGPVKAVEGCLNQRSHDTAHGNLIPTLIRLAIMLHPQSEYNNRISLTQSIQSSFVLKGNVGERMYICNSNVLKYQGCTDTIFSRTSTIPIFWYLPIPITDTCISMHFFFFSKYGVEKPMRSNNQTNRSDTSITSGASLYIYIQYLEI